MVTQLASALVATGAAASPFGASPAPRGQWRTANDDARLLRYRTYLNFDAGKQDVGRLATGEAPVVANYARVFVRKGASFLFPDAATVAVMPPDNSPDAAVVAARLGAALDDVRRDNDLDAADLGTAIDAAVLGDGAFKISWDRGRGCPRIVPVDPQRLFVVSALDDVRRPETVRDVLTMRPSDVQNAYGLTSFAISASDTVETVEEWTEARYIVRADGQVISDVKNPYGFIPYLVFPNTQRPHEFWGLSDLADLLPIQNAVNRRLSVLNVLLDIAGNPVTILENISGTQGVSVAPGAIWEIPENAKAYILELLGSGTVDQHIKYIEGLYRIMDDLSEMPRLAWGDGSGGARSGVALAIALQPIVQKTQRKRVVWSGVLERRARYSLMLMERFGDLDLGSYVLSDFGLRAVWPPILPSDRSVLVEDTIKQYEKGLLSQRSSIKALGADDVEAEIEQIAGETPPPIIAALSSPGPQSVAGEDAGVSA